MGHVLGSTVLQGWALCSVTFPYPLHATDRLKRLSTSSRIGTIIPSRTTHESRHTLSTLMLHERHCTCLRQRGECYDIVMRAATIATPAHMVDASSPGGRHSSKLWHLALCELLTALQSIHGTFASDTEQAAPNRGQPADSQRTSRASTSSSEDATYITRCAVASATQCPAPRSPPSNPARENRPSKFTYAVGGPTLYTAANSYGLK